jgi:hypothetical protein
MSAWFAARGALRERVEPQMADIVFLAHLPLLRIPAESVPFLGGDLWRMPFDTYRAITAGAFDRPREYEATSPVFYRRMEALELPFMSKRTEADTGSMFQLKWASGIPSTIPLLEAFISHFVEPAWAALMLSAPGAALPPPRMSCVFVETPDQDVMFELGGRFSSIQLQGDADHEYLFSSELALEPLADDALARARSIGPQIEGLRNSPAASAALDALLATSAPSLAPAEQLTIAVTALEALLLPEVRSGLKATFARRGSNLLSSDPEEREALSSTLRTLYDLRSASVHGSDLRHATHTSEALRCAFAEQLLAAALLEVNSRLRGLGLDALRTALDTEQRQASSSGPVSAARALPASPPTPLRAPERLRRASRPRSAISFGTLPSMAAKEGATCSWAPLVGLGADGEVRLGQTQGAVLVPLSGDEILALEERDARADFLAPLIISGVTHSCLFTGSHDESLDALARAEPALLRDRDLAVLALRFAGFTEFDDPELLGTYLYHGSLRWRRPTTIRQTVLRRLQRVPTQVFSPDAQRLTDPFVRLLYDYDANGQHVDVEHVLAMLRRTFDRHFLPPGTTARLMFGALEAMLGRFRRAGEGVALEALVRRGAGASSGADWFDAEGRATRNAVAHGRFRGIEASEQAALIQLQSLLVAVVPAFLKSWMSCSERERLRPATAFIASLSA